MIIKPLETPLYMLQMEALSNRLPMAHLFKEEVTTKARNQRAGYNGERALTFPLSFLSDEKYHLFYNLRIPDSHGFFQIDMLILTMNFILIIEVKNIRGQVVFDDLGQTIRLDGDTEQGFKNPIDQVKLQHARLQRWLSQFDFPAIPIEKLVVYSNSSTILKNLSNDKEISKLVTPIGRLQKKIEMLTAAYDAVRMSEEQLLELSHQLLSAHTVENDDVMEKYKVTYEQLIKGVICPGCRYAPMLRKVGKWHCPHCRQSSKEAHRSALVDYALLVDRHINNRQARDFLRLESSNVAKQLLQKENFSQVGVKKGRKYMLDVRKLISRAAGTISW